MLPGLSIYAAMFSFIEGGDVIGGGQLAIRALSVGLALAAGVTLGEFLASPLRSEMDRWERRVRQRARQRGVELPLVISDHADWDELTRTLQEVQAQEVWVTHGSEEALIHWSHLHGIRARALSLIGRGEEEEEAA